MPNLSFPHFIRTRTILIVSVANPYHDPAVLIGASGTEIHLTAENKLPYQKHDFTVSDDATAVLIYDGEFFIEQLVSGRYLLQIENQSYVSFKLDTLESILFGWID
mgnify:CR=1 FL=1